MLYKKEMNPNGRNGKMEASNSQHELSVKDKKVMIPGGWNSQGRQAILTILTLFKVTGRPTTPNIVLALVKTP